MQISINEQPLDLNLQHCRNLEEVLVEVADHWIPEGEQVFQVKVNGGVFSERYPRESRYIDLDTITRLEINTVSDRELAGAILQKAANQAEILIQALEKGATLFRLADENEANFYFAQVLDSLRWLFQIGQLGGQVLNIDLAHHPEGSRIEDFLTRLEGLLTEMTQVHQDGDFILLADLMEYELLPAVNEWQTILVHLNNAAEK